MRLPRTLQTAWLLTVRFYLNVAYIFNSSVNLFIYINSCRLKFMNTHDSISCKVTVTGGIFQKSYIFIPSFRFTHSAPSCANSYNSSCLFFLFRFIFHAALPNAATCWSQTPRESAQRSATIIHVFQIFHFFSVVCTHKHRQKEYELRRRYQCHEIS